MLKALLVFFTIIIPIYLIGDKIRRNPKIDAFVGAVEWRYANLNNQLEQASIRSGLLLIKKLYGWASVALITFCISTIYILPTTPKTFVVAFNLFLYLFLAWFSIKWTLEHKSTLIEYAKNNAIFILMPLLAGTLDSLLDTPFASALSAPIQHAFAALKISPPPFHPFTIGMITSCFMLASFAILYCTAWVLSTPLFIASLIITMVPIYCARFLAAIDRNNTFMWLAIFIGAASGIGLALL